MKQKLLWLVLLLATAAQGAGLDAGTTYPPELRPVPQEAEAAHLAAEVLTRYHYKAMPLDAGLSGRIFDQYLKSLDPEKLFFVQADIDQLARDRTRLGEAIVKEDLTVPFAIFNTYQKRAAERFTYAHTLLKKGFDFRRDEYYRFDRNNEAWPKTESEARDLWRKRVKNDWLRLKLAGEDDKSIVDILDKRYDGFSKRIGQVKSTDAFQTFMNAYTMAIDPHTNYLGPRAAEDFDISMRLSLVGIGAVLQERDEYATIRELLPGGPASRSGQLNIGDRIVGVAQGESGVIADVQGWRLDDTVALIRGTPDSIVVLDVLPAEAGPDGKHKRVSLVRKTITLEQQAAKASVQTVTNGTATRRVGVISLPSFYEDFAARQEGVREYKSATRDVAHLLEELKKQKVDSVLIDLRNNGGGSLAEAIDLTGLFIDTGPVVQERNARGQISVEKDTNAGVAWEGPLGVLINRGSASASEIFAAAIQDYGRGLIIGEPSFGKGTVQTVVDLDQIAKHSTPQFGELKMTVAQFFRINGGTTQLRGVEPDIPLPAVISAEDFGESSFDNALPWSQVKAADYSPAGDLKGLLPLLLTLHETRVGKDKDFRYLQEDLAEAKLQRKKNLISLNEAERRKERDAREARLKARDAQREGGNGASNEVAGDDGAADGRVALRDDGLQPGERDLAKELTVENARKNAKDLFLNEAVNILGDELEALPAGGEFAARAKPAPVAAPN
jgi:carboxyl-terminal processing protease